MTMPIGSVTLDRGNVRVCFRCGEPGSACEVTHNDAVVALGALCERCWENFLEEGDRLRQEFEALLEAGLSREQANARMVDKIEGRNGRA